MRISEAAKETGLSVSNIRFYERKGLLAPSREEDSKYRDYTEEDIEQLKRIILFRKMDVPVETIFLIETNALDLRKALEGQQEILFEKQRMLQGSVDLCRRILEDPDMDKLNTDFYLDYVKTEEDRGRRFAEVEEFLEDVSEFMGMAEFRYDPHVGKFLQNPWIVRGISLLWLVSCLLLPISAIVSMVAEGNVSDERVFLWIVWAVCLTYAFWLFRRRNHSDLK